MIAYPVFLFAAFGIGLRLLRLFRWEPESRLVQFFVAITLGYAFIGQFVFLLGLVHLLYNWVIWLAFILMVLANFGIVVLFFKRARFENTLSVIRDYTFLEQALFFMCLIVLILYAFFSLAPQIHWDAMSHHYLVPEHFLKMHALVDFPDVVFSYYPSIIEMQYLAGMALGGEVTANLIGNSHGIIMFIGIFALSLMVTGKCRPGIWAGVFFLCTQGIHMHFEGGWNDLGVSIFILSGVMLMFEYCKNGHKGVFYLSAIMMGAALAGKHYAWLPFLFVMFFLYYDMSVKKIRFGEQFKKFGAYKWVALSMPLLWYLRSYVLTGNPFYPFSIFGLFPTYHLPPFVITSWVNQGFPRNILTFLMYPFYLMLGSSWIPQLTGRLPYLMLLMPLTFYEIRNRDIRAIWMFILSTLFVMYFVAPFETRYMLYMLPFMGILCGISVTLLLERVKAGRRFILPMAFLTFLIPFSMNQKIFEHDWSDKKAVIFKQEWRDEYLLRQSHTYGMIWWMNNNLPDGAKVLCLEKFLYRLDRDYVTWPGMKIKYPEDAQEAMEKNFEYGNTHMFLGEGGMAQAYVLWHIYQLPEDEDGFVNFRVDDILLSLKSEPIPEKFWILRLSMKRDLERWGFEKIENEGETKYRIKRELLDKTETNMAALKLVSLFKDMIAKKWIVLLKEDGLNMVFSFNYDKWQRDVANGDV
ncbi:MAG: hypothetical protein ABIG42_11780 [bacterium]